MNTVVQAHQLTLIDAPMAGLYPCPMEEANALLVRWKHSLGSCQRPFGQHAYGLKVNGDWISVAVSASIVSARVAGYYREQVVECARLCSAPESACASRLMLRLWRECCAPNWSHWPVSAAVSYAMNAQHTGNLYRFDGWQRIADDCGSSGGGTWSKKRLKSDARARRKTLWLWRYDK